MYPNSKMYVPVHSVWDQGLADVSLKMLPSQTKVDDDDGHYIVIPDTDLTERCECS